MISFRDMTFCSASECAGFNKCPRALTDDVRSDARRWWGNDNAPISRFANPKLLKCYVALDPLHTRRSDVNRNDLDRPKVGQTGQAASDLPEVAADPGDSKD